MTDLQNTPVRGSAEQVEEWVAGLKVDTGTLSSREFAEAVVEMAQGAGGVPRETEEPPVFPAAGTHANVPCPVFDWCGEHNIIPGERPEDQWHVGEMRRFMLGQGADLEELEVTIYPQQDTNGQPMTGVEISGSLAIPGHDLDGVEAFIRRLVNGTAVIK
jgi:hypothetical protein